jgi:lysophospholipase L1-like esterase
MMMASLLVLGGLCAVEEAVVIEDAMPVRVTEAWTVEIGPGSVTVDGREVRLDEGVTFTIAPPETVQIRDEQHGTIPVFNPKTGGWLRGAKLKALIAQECTATGLLSEASVRIKPEAGAAEPFKLDADYAMDTLWATFGRLEGGAIAADQPVFVDYDYSPSRLDSVMVDVSGKARLVAGEPGTALVFPPESGPGEVAVANIWVAGRTESLTAENLYPIVFSPPEAKEVGETQAEKVLPKTLAKLRAGEKVTIVAWGDSVTCGGGVGQYPDLWWQQQFVTRLRERFPQATIELLTAGWGGSSSKRYMDEPRGGKYDFVRDVLDPKPDLVVIEFVNDAYLNVEKTQAHYAVILEHLRGVGAEVILNTPHYVRPDWMGVDTLKVSDDPRPYVAGLKLFAKNNNLGLADASAEWGKLWRKGLPYTTLLGNAINHPDGRGHALFADALMGLFPAE